MLARVTAQLDAEQGDERFKALADLGQLGDALLDNVEAAGNALAALGLALGAVLAAAGLLGRRHGRYMVHW